MLVTSRAELHAALRNARPGAVIELAPGEYHGPFIIERPVNLRGQQRRTVLWRHGGPVVYVRSEGVRLERLLIERTVQRDGPLVIHDAGCVPAGKESMELDANTLINLGDLLPGSTITLPLEIETAARAEIVTTGLYGARVNPAVLERPGKHLVYLILDGKAVLKGEVLLGEITVREGGTVRHIWLTGSVLESAPTDRLLCLNAGRMRLYPSVTGLALTSTLFAALGLGSAPEGRYAFIQRDPTGALYVFLPGEPPVPVRLNDSEVPSNARCLLVEGNSLQVGDVMFSVQPGEPLPVELPASAVAFADFDMRFPDALTFTVKTGKQGWRGQVLAAVPWLTVAPEGQFRIPPSRSHDWTIALNADALALPDGLYEVPGGLLINSANHVYGIDVRLNVQRPEVALHAAPLEIGPLEFGWHAPQSLDLSIANVGRGDWLGEIRTNVPWLEVLTPNPISGATWSETLVQVRAAPDWKHKNAPAVGVHEIPNALVITGARFPDKPIAARLEVLPPQGHLTLLTPMVDFGEVEYNTPLPSFALEMRNDGAAVWVGRVHAQQGWVRIEDADESGYAELSLLPGQTHALMIALLDIPADQPLDQTILVDELYFDAGPNSAPLAAPVPAQLTIVERPPYLVARPVSFPPFVKGDNLPDGSLRIYNMGPATWRGGVVANLPWLHVTSRVYECPPGESIDITVGLRALDALKPGLSRWENALSVTGGRELVNAPVMLDLREMPTELHLETTTLNFGQVNGAITDIGAETVRLLNAGPNAWSGTVTLAVPWLSFEGSARRSFDLEIPKMSVAEFKVTLNDAVLALKPGTTADDKALIIAGQGQSVNVRALVATTEMSPVLSVTPGKVILNASKPGQITLRNEGTRRWSVQVNAVPWLAVAPTDVTLEPGQAQAVELRHRLNEVLGKNKGKLRKGRIGDPRAVVIVGPSREFDVEVEITAAAVEAALAEAIKAVPPKPIAVPDATSPIGMPDVPDPGMNTPADG